MDGLRSNLAGYYTPQQYTPVPLPSYPPPAFSNPSPYPGHHLDETETQNFNLPLQYDHDHLTQAQTVARSQLQTRALAQARASAQNSERENANTTGDLNEDAASSDNAARKKSKPGGSAPKGFGRTSAVYRIDGEGVKRRVNAEEFRAEVEERTRNGESCEQIADALIAQGAQVTSKSISRWRILWGFRKRAVRKQSKPPKPKEQRMNSKQIWQSKYKADITRMTQQGLDVEEVARIMTARGMQLKKGSSTIARLQTVWNLRGTEETRAKNKRYLSRRKARQQQLEEFQHYAAELELESPDQWVKKKMEEPAVKKMRHDAAYEMMGDAAPSPRETRSGRSGIRKSAVKPNEQAPETAPGYKPTEYAYGSSDDEEPTANSPTNRTLRSGQGPVRADLMQGLDYDDSESSDGDQDDHPMEGLNHDNTHHMNHDEDRQYQALMEQGNDDLDDEDEIFDKHDAPTAPHNLLPAPQSPVGIMDAHLAFVPPAAEQESVDELIGIADNCISAAQLLKDLLQAKSQARPGPRSLTGLPPSARDIEMARHRLKEAAVATSNFLQNPA